MRATATAAATPPEPGSESRAAGPRAGNRTPSDAHRGDWQRLALADRDVARDVPPRHRCERWHEDVAQTRFEAWTARVEAASRRQLQQAGYFGAAQLHPLLATREQRI